LQLLRATEPVELCPMTPIIIARTVPSRIGELLPPAVDCERVFVDGTPGEMSDLDNPRGREVRYAIEYFDEKAQRFKNKFVPSEMSRSRSPGAVGPPSRPRRRYADAPAAALLPVSRLPDVSADAPPIRRFSFRALMVPPSRTQR
jgi:hypothetical protein